MAQRRMCCFALASHHIQDTRTNRPKPRAAGVAAGLRYRAMDDLERAVELIDRAIDSLSVAAVRHPALREQFARWCERLRLLMDEVQTARERTRRGEATS